MTLSPAQRSVLAAMEQGATLIVHMSYFVRFVPSGERVHRTTFYSLNLRGLIESQDGDTTYRISPAGRTALEGTKT